LFSTPPVLYQQNTGGTRQEPRADPQRSTASGGDAWRLLGALFLCGSLMGPPLDGIHTNVGLLQYDSLPLELGAPTSLLDRRAVARMLQLRFTPAITCCAGRRPMTARTCA